MADANEELNTSNDLAWINEQYQQWFAQKTEQQQNAMPRLTLMQFNGRKVLSPPKGWIGPPPSSACELYVRRIPKHMSDQKIIEPFLRFGRIYEIRLPMDFNQANRGYAYIKYTNEEDAACAIEVISHYYISPRYKLEVLPSYEKCRLFITNIPRHLTLMEIEEKFRQIFPNLDRIYSRGNVNAGRIHGIQRDGLAGILDDFADNDSGFQHDADDEFDPIMAGHEPKNNAGHVFVQFVTHKEALEAKKNTTPGIIRVWGSDLKVVWANNDRNVNVSLDMKTLFLRNVEVSVNTRDLIDLLTQFVPRMSIRKISKVRSAAFVDFTTRQAAEKCLMQLQGIELRERILDVEWAKPSEEQALQRMCNTDFDKVLRLKCIANGWQIPVIIFGTSYEANSVQYAAVMMRDGDGNARGIFCLMHTSDVIDLHSRLCEVACVLIETIGQFPDYNYLFDVFKDNAHLLGMVTHSSVSVDFIAAHRVPWHFQFDLHEVIELSWAIATLSSVHEEQLLQAYNSSFETSNMYTYLQNWVVLGTRLFGTIFPRYRYKPSLQYKLNNAQIVLVLCYICTGSNRSLCIRPHLNYSVAQFDRGYDRLKYISLKLLPIALIHSRLTSARVMNCVNYDGFSGFGPIAGGHLAPMALNYLSRVGYSTMRMIDDRDYLVQNPEREERD